MRGHGLGRELACDDCAGDVGEELIVVAGVLAYCREGGVHVEPGTRGEHTFGLLDDDPAVERVLQLLGQCLPLLRNSMLEDADGRNIRDCLCREHVVGVEWSGAGAQEIQRADRMGAQPHGKREHGPDPGVDGPGREGRPATERGMDALARHGQAGAETIDAWSFIVVERGMEWS